MDCDVEILKGRTVPSQQVRVAREQLDQNFEEPLYPSQIRAGITFFVALAPAGKRRQGHGTRFYQPDDFIDPLLMEIVGCGAPLIHVDRSGEFEAAPVSGGPGDMRPDRQIAAKQLHCRSDGRNRWAFDKGAGR